MTDDKKKLDRAAQFLIVQIKKSTGSPPKYKADWSQLWSAKVERIVDNINATPSEAVFWFPDKRWNDQTDIAFGDMIRILSYDGIVLFQGFVVRISRQFSGGNESGGKYERNAVVCLDYRWLLASTSPVYGQVGRSPDDYKNFGTSSQTPIEGAYTHFTGRRCIFNVNGMPNADPTELVVIGRDGSQLCTMPIFANADDNAKAFTAGDMIRYILSPITNWAYDYWPINNPAKLIGLDHSDWSQVLSNVSIEGLNTATALQLVCKQIGWAFRIDYDNNTPAITFFKAGSAVDTTRSRTSSTILHTLFTPAPIDADAVAATKSVKAAVEAGKKMLWAAQYEQDIANVVNNPFYMGAPFRYEFTAELVPAWLDSELMPDTSDNYANLYCYEADLKEFNDPNTLSFFKYYHTRGSQFLRSVGRIWALNESGRYTDEGTYDRGMPFDLASVLPPEYVFDSSGKRLYGSFDRQLLPCLTRDKQSNSSVGIIVEFSFDAGSTWHKIPAAIVSLEDQCGIYIAEPNLAEIAPEDVTLIDTGDLAGIELNYWTSLCGDKLAGRSFKSGEWKTRVRVTASVQLDQRLGGQVEPLHSGSPFWQRDVWDFSGDYFYQKRIEGGAGASIFASGDLNADVRDDCSTFKMYIEYLRNTLQDASISGQFTLERLWLNTFRPGDCIGKIEGRDCVLKTQNGVQTLYPEIVQIIYLPQHQKVKLITRDLRFSEMR